MFDKAKVIFEKFDNKKILLAYSVLTLIILSPVLVNIASSVVGSDDSWWNIWWMWWIKQSTLSGKSYLFTDFTFHPTGIDLTFDSANFFNHFIAFPLQFFLDRVVIFNLLVLVSFILSGFFMYLLANHLTSDKKASFLAGIIYTFSTYHMIRLNAGHLDLLTMQWIPLFVLYLFKTKENGGWKNILIASVSLFLSMMSTWYYLIYSLIFMVFYFAYLLWKKQINKELVLNFSKVLVLAAILITPFALPLFLQLCSGAEPYAETSLGIWASGDLLGFLIPSKLHPVFGSYTEPIFSNFTGSSFESTTYIGFTVIILSILGALKTKNKFWIVVGLLGMLLSLGPVLHINGNILIPAPGINLGNFASSLGYDLPNQPYNFLDGKSPKEALNNNVVIPLPYLLLQKLPLLGPLRAPVRIFVLSILAFSVLSAFALKGRKDWLLLSVGLLILFESLTIPLNVLDSQTPQFYYNLQKEEGDFAIMEVPFEIKSMYYQTIHEKKMVYGYSSRTPISVVKYIDETPLINQLTLNRLPFQRDRENWNRPNVNPDDPEALKRGLGILKESNIKYVIVHKDKIEPDVLENVTLLLDRVISKKENMGDLIIYESR